MNRVANIMVGLVALLHAGFMVLEMFFWDHAVGERVFELPREVLHSSAVLAANQGLYNGFLAAGLAWALVTGKHEVKLSVLGCVVVAGVFGAFTAKFSILFMQAMPGLLALVLVRMSRPRTQAR
ncbi:DUF1304 domain-containing protein [Archangium gephyra]|nr:DUF1304 domain-containing protein [Archangium gephyra]